MNYRLIQHYANKFPPEIREDIFQEGCVAVLEEKNIYPYMVDKYRWWTKYRRRNKSPFQIFRIDRDHEYSFASLRDTGGTYREHFEELSYKSDIHEKIYLKETLPKLNNVMSELKPKWRKILHLRYWQKMKLREIGDQFGVSESDVSILHKKILEVLRLRLNEKPNPRACQGQN